jgi:hypothetical protein
MPSSSLKALNWYHRIPIVNLEFYTFFDEPPIPANLEKLLNTFEPPFEEGEGPAPGPTGAP